ncbi:hypothetical protein JCM10213_007290 [Rhodosporidiobolus nylandii]
MALPLLQEQPPPLAPLPPPTRSLLRSTAILPSLPQILTELVQNALDATATRITTHIDLDTWTVRCDDNGRGFPAGSLADVGRYSTSKLPCPPGAGADEALSGVETYGFRGEALASMADVATLEVRSRARDSGETDEVVLRDGEVLQSGKAGVQRAGQGTIVVVRDIFWKFPVRRRPLLKAAAQATLLTQLRSSLSVLALIHPAVSFSLTDTTSSVSSVTGEGKKLLQLQRAGEGLLGRWKQLWGRAGVERVWEFEDEAEGGVKAKGFFSLSAAHSKAGQHIFVNSRPLSATASPLHKLLNTLISSSSFSRHAASHLSFPSPASPARGVTSAPTSKAARKSPKKAVERHPVFLVCLEVPGNWVDVSLEPEKKVIEFTDPARIESFLTTLTKWFLVQNGFVSITSAPLPPPPSSGEASTPRKRPRAPSPMRVASAPSSAKRRAPPRGAAASAPLPVANPFASALPQNGEGVEGAEKPLRWIDPVTRQPFLVDPRTGNSWRDGTRPDLEGRLPASAGGEGCERCEEGIEKRGPREGGFVERGWLRRRRDKLEQEEGEKPEWLSEVLEDYTNPTFAAPALHASSAARIPSLPALPANPIATAAAPTLTSAFTSSKRSLSSTSSSAAKRFASSAPAALTHNRVKTISTFFSTSLPSAPSLSLSQSRPSSSAPGGLSNLPERFTREALGRAEFIAQVDEKFLLCLIPSPPPSSLGGGGGTLVLVDQHAASERVRVEQFWAELAGARAVEETHLDGEGRIGVVVSAQEAADVMRWEGCFARWGMRFAPRVDEQGEAGDYAQLFLTSVPTLLSLRLTSEPKTVQELVRSFVAELRERGAASLSVAEFEARREEDGQEDGGWAGRVKDAPLVLKELVESKACRGAVMFNDALSPAQCASLLTSLAATRFPFQCAHGRPSLVPLVNLPSLRSSFGAGGGSAGSRAGASGVDWAKLA